MSGKCAQAECFLHGTIAWNDESLGSCVHLYADLCRRAMLRRGASQGQATGSESENGGIQCRLVVGGG